MTHSFFRKYIKDIFWITPFIFFLAGYQFLNVFFYKPTTKAPLLIGKTLPQALVSLSQNNLNMRMIAQREDPDVPAGTIISQTPRAQSAIRPQQTVFLVISKKPVQPLVPDLRNKTATDYAKILKELKLRYRCFPLVSNHPENTCLAQIPTPEKELPAGGAILYIASQDTSSVLFPSFKGKSVEEVKTFLKKYDLTPNIYHTYDTHPSHSCKHCKVAEQKPLAGSFVSLKEPFSIQLKI